MTRPQMSSLKCPNLSSSNRSSSHHHGRPRNFLSPTKSDKAVVGQGGGSDAGIVGTRFATRKSPPVPSNNNNQQQQQQTEVLVSSTTSCTTSTNTTTTTTTSSQQEEDQGERPPLLRRLSSNSGPSGNNACSSSRYPPPLLPALVSSELVLGEEEEEEEDEGGDGFPETCEDYVEWPVDKDTVRDEEEVVSEEDFHISDESAVLTALRIPENIVPTPHTQFIQSLSRKQQQGRPTVVSGGSSSGGGGGGGLQRRRSQESIISRGIKMPEDDDSSDVGVNIGDDGSSDIKTESADGDSSSTSITVNNPASIIGGGPGGTVSIMKDQTDRKLRSAFAKYKKLDEADRCKLEKLGENKILINGSIVIERDYENYTRETDVVLEFDEDWKKCKMPPLPAPTAPNCQAPPCRLGCVCESIIQDSIARSHCGKPKCFFDCNCLLSLFSNGDDGDIRSRLRPRVSLLNWRYMEPTEREKEPPVNYRQLERGATIYPRMRRVAVAPQRFRNEFVMAHKFKDSFRRERRAATNSLKFIRKTPLKRDNHTKMYRASYGMRAAQASAQAKSKESIPTKLRQCKPCTVTIDPLLSCEEKAAALNDSNKEESQRPQQPEQLEVPHLIQLMTEDGQVILMGSESMCFFAWTLNSKHPRAVLYNGIHGDILPIPWLYVPIPSSGEAWLFHQLPSRTDCLKETSFIHIPEINATIHSKALQMQIEKAQDSGRGMQLEIQWIGEKSEELTGSMYIFPQLPRVLLCGPFPKSQLKMRGGPDMCSTKFETIRNAVKYVKKMTASRYMGDHHMWNSLSTRKQDMVYENLMAKVAEDESKLRACNLIYEYDGPASEDIALRIHSQYAEASRDVNKKLGYEKSDGVDSYIIPPTDLTVSWTDAAHLLSLRPAVT